MFPLNTTVCGTWGACFRAHFMYVSFHIVTSEPKYAQLVSGIAFKLLCIWMAFPFPTEQHDSI